MYIRLLGPVSAGVADRAFDLGPAQQRAVLAALVVDAGRPVSLDELAARVWDRPPRAARNALYAHMSRLRGLVAAATPERVRLERVGAGYVIHVPRECVDLLRFQDLVRESGGAQVAPERRAALLGEALRLWHGTPLAGLETTWAVSVRESWELQRATAAAQWAATEFELGRPASVVSELAAILPSRPLAEALVYELMRALHATGRTAEALDWYDRTRRHLARELGCDPGQALRELHMAILRGTAERPRRSPGGPGAQGPTGSGPRGSSGPSELSEPAEPSEPSEPSRSSKLPEPPGQYPSSDQAPPPRPSQPPEPPRDAGPDILSVPPVTATAQTVTSAATTPSAPTTATAPTTPTAPTTTTAASAAPAATAQLPAYAPGFTGRADYLQRLNRFLDAGQRTIILSGAAGVGKTTLAVHWAHQVRHRFPDGQLYVNLHGFSSRLSSPPAEVLARFLRALGVPPQEVPIDLDEAAALYRSLVADKRILVLLDNAASADQVRPLIPGSAHSLVLVTSRNRLSRLVAGDGARRLTLDVMTESEAVELLAGLLADRDEADQRALGELAAACGRLPLALRVCAATLSDRPAQRLPDFVEALYAGDRLTALAATDDGEIAVQAAFDLSYRALAEPARRLFCLIGTFPGPDFATDAVAGLAGLPREQADRLLDQLAAMHMIHAVAADRYTFHDLLRLYAQRRCAAEVSGAERHEALRRLCEYYLVAVDAAARKLYPQVFRLPAPADFPGPAEYAFSDHRQAKAWLDDERANLVALVRGAAAEGLNEPAWLIADWLRGYLGLQQPFADWFALAETGLAAAAVGDDLLGQAAAHHSLAQACHSVSRFEQALEHLAKARALSAEGGWSEGHTAALCNLGVVYADLGMLRDAVAHFSQALEVNQRTGSLVGTAVNLENLGDAHRVRHDLDEAVGFYKAAHTLYREIGSPLGQASTLTSLSGVFHALGDAEQALGHAERGLALHRENGNQLGQATALTELVRIYLADGQHQAAIESARAAVTLNEEFGDRRAKAAAHSALAAALAAVGEHAEAMEQYRVAHAMSTVARIPYHEVVAALGIARLRAAHPEVVDGPQAHAATSARELAEKSLRTARESGFRGLEAEALEVLAMVDAEPAGV